VDGLDLLPIVERSSYLRVASMTRAPLIFGQL
jgi:hypothetical protein